ncbi:MAG: hypothetical protein A3I00_05040 [Betaproteobacteria bacterium RIFCSPLOWO2_02_FULL_64_12]|nr:MAG: hypothetical protein A3I00_05040 [Betaproteobacteria bacterium RIFCSPLOWO2_02_FULL_64_12]
MENFGFSKSVQRIEDPRLLRGAGRYTDDVNLPRQAHGHVLRSPHAHARIRGIDVAAARGAPGVLLVLTGADYIAAGFGPMPLIMHAVPGFDPKKVFAATHWPLATDRARFVGDGIAFIVAETRARAIDAAESIEVDYEPLPSVTDAARAAEPDAPRVWDDCPGNIAFACDMGNAGAAEQAFSRAAHVVKRRMRINRLSANPMEPRGVVADFNPAKDFFTVYLGTQDTFRARAQIAKDLLKIPEEKIRVVAGDVGGSFGMKGALYPETPLAVWASKLLGRPVKWVGDRSESFMSDSHARDKWVDAELALDDDYRFLAIRVHALANVGAYYSTLATFPIVLSTSGIAGSYMTPAIHFRATGVFTNTNPTAPYRGSGRPDASFIGERLIDYAARELGVAADEIRRRNHIPMTAMPYKTPLGGTYDSGDFPANQSIALERAEYAGFAARRQASAARGRLRGIGIGANVENAAPPGQEQVKIEIDAAGDATLWAGSTDQGQGHATMYTQIACEQLGLAPDRVRVTEGDTGTLSQGGGTGGSKVSALGALAVYEATRQLIAKGKKIAAQVLEAAEGDIEFALGRFTVSGTDRAMTLAQVARAANDKPPAGVAPGLSASGSHKTSLPTWPSGCHVCELEIDPETGVVAMLRYVAVTDLGRAVNPLQANGQIHGGIVQALGQVLSENIAYDAASGQLLSGSFMDYGMPRGDSVCAIECYDNPVPTAINPLGVKGAGEVGAGCAVPAVMNAVADALSPLGIHHLDMPCTPERVWRAIREAAK